MIAYIKSVLVEMPEEMKGKAPSPAAAHLFKVNANAVSIDDDHATIFHRLVMQVQYMSQRARPDLRTAVSFLSRRVAKPDVDDYRKLTRLMKIHSGDNIFEIDVVGRWESKHSVVD